METITNEIFYDELIKALKSDKKVFNLKDVSIKGGIWIGEIYERIKDDDKLKHLILSEGNETTVYLDVDISIRNVIFENEIDFYFWDGYVTIYVKFKKVEFKNCIFKEKANFRFSKFEKDADFFMSEFEKDADFFMSEFEGYAIFTESKYKEEADFTGSKFEKDADFFMSEFEKDAIFTGKFKGYAYFKESNFKGKANFTYSTFERGGANFTKSKFERDADFYRSEFKEKYLFSWDKILGNDKENLIDFLKWEFSIDWVENIEIKKNDDKTIKITTENNYLSLKINDEETEINLEIDDGTTNKFIVNKENGNLNIYTGGADFSESKFKGKADFTKSNFKGDANFKCSTFEQYAKFYDSTFENCASFVDLTFEEDAIFEKSIFKKDADFSESKFKGKADFTKSNFKGKAMFDGSTFKGNAYFNKVIFNNVHFSHSIFNAVASFLDISYKLLSFKECTFESTTYFKNKEKEEQMPAFFNLINFKNANNTTLTDFSLSTTSFILTDVKDIVIISDTSKNKKIFDEKLLEITPKEKLEEDELKKKLKENMEKNISDEKILSGDFIEKVIDISPYLRHETVLKEYRDIRKSFEKHRTYSEASNLFIREMDLIKKNSNMPKKIIFTLYKLISKYGESIWLPLGWSIFFIILLPIIAISFAYSINHVPILYLDTLGQVLRAFFQLKMFPPENVLFITHWEWFIRVVSLILLTNIALTLVKQLKRR